MSRNFTLNPQVLGGQAGQFYVGTVGGGSGINANNSNTMALYANNLNIFSGNAADTASWTDAVTTTTFQVGASSSNMLFAGLSGTAFNRLCFTASNIQWSGKGTGNAAPVDYFEMKTGGATVASAVQVLAITRRGNIKGTPSANFPFLTLTGFSSTGSDASGMIDLAGTWNTSGVITGIKLNVTNTASGAGSNLIDLQVASTSKFAVDTAGVVTAPKFVSTAVVRLKGYTVAGLPAGTQGDTAFATDLLAPGFLVAVVGGGAVVGPVFYNGAAWVAY